MMNTDRIYYSRNAEMHALRANLRLIMLFLTMGLGVGAVLALLFAPATGKKTRDELAKTVEEGLQNGRDAVQPMVKHLEKDLADLQKNIGERVNDLTN